MPDVTITPDEARRRGLVGPVYHGSPDFKGRKFDPKYRARSSGLSRGGFSFSDDVASADSYAAAPIDSAQAAVDSANDVMREAAGRMERGLKIKGFSAADELPEFNVRYVDDISELSSYFNELAKDMPKDLATRLRDAAKQVNEPANPVVVEAYLRNPKTMDIDGKKLWLVDNPDDIFVSAARPPQGAATGRTRGQAMPDVSPQDAFEYAKRRHGTTRSIYEAGYVLPDGTMLDFSGKSDAGGYERKPDGNFGPQSGQPDYLRDTRNSDHREIRFSESQDFGGNEAMTEFMRKGAVRVDANSGLISIHGRQRLTSAQKSALKDIVRSQDGAWLDLEDDAGNRTSLELKSGKWAVVEGLLNQWADGKTPRPRAQFMPDVEYSSLEQQAMTGNPAATEAAQSAVNRAARSAGLIKGWHGSSNLDSIEIFDKGRIGTKNDAGFYGRGFYFTFGDEKYSPGEAGYYGSQVGEFFLKAENPFVFSELTEFKGSSINFMGVDSLVFLKNVADKFPAIGKKITVDTVKWKNGEGEVKPITASQLSKLIDYYDRNIKIVTVEDSVRGNYKAGYTKTETIEYDHTSSGGSKGSFESQNLTGRVQPDLSDAETKILLIAEFLEKEHGIKADYHPEGYMTRFPEITEAIRKNGHDAIMQGRSGDEIVVFEPEQIKSAAPFTYDKKGKLIPLSKRFNFSRPEISYGVAASALAAGAAMSELDGEQ